MVPPGDNEERENELQGSPDYTPPLRRLTRLKKPVDRLTFAMTSEIIANTAQDIGEIFCLEAIYPDDSQEEDGLLAFAASADPDTMYLHQAMKEPDKQEFVKAMQKEVQGQIHNGNFSVIPRSQVPEGASVLPAVWAMQRKRKVMTGKVYKWKARLNIDGSRQVKGRDYWETYAPVANWASIRLVLIMSIMHGWNSRQIDYVMA